MKEFIKDFDKLSAALKTDKTPSFHDAEILSITLNRELTDLEKGVSIEVKVLVLRFIEKIARENGEFYRFRKAVAELKFLKSRFDRLENFNHQNVINDLYISRIENSEAYLVHFESIFGCDLRFECKEIELARVETFETEEKAFQPDLEQIRKIKELRETIRAAEINEKTDSGIVK